MPEALSPGMYVEETSLRSHSIEGVSTSTTGFIGVAELGPFRQSVPVTSFAEFQRVFGALQEKAELGYAVRLYFDNGGQKAWIVRVDGQTEIPSAVGAFDAEDTIGLLCIPGCVDGPTLLAAVAYCDKRRTCLVVDPPSSDVRAA